MSPIIADHLIITLFSVMGTITAAVIAVFVERRLSRQDGVLKEIHVMVNSRLEEALRTIALLKATVLEQSGDAPLTPESAAIVDELRANSPDIQP